MSKLKIDPYIVNLIKQNLIYIVSLLIFIALAIFVLPFQIRSYFELKERNTALNKELINLEQKKSFFYSFDADQIDKLIETLDRLLPNKEDYFSIFTTLDALSNQTGFALGDVSLSVNDTSPETLAINVLAVGSSYSYKTFLESYQYKGGRLITMDEVYYDPNEMSPPVSLTLNFHSKNIQLESSAVETFQFDQKSYDLIKKISNELDGVFSSYAVFDEKSASQTETEYKTRNNPFAPL